ncbi:MAG: ATP-binding cassette domain-containing protein, partial [Clostridiales Family XIII bacterium]|nr:ATP-binding cassette domain-containing protein [Clostridiales Family XIII bacterium]
EFAEHASSVTAEGSAELIKRLGLESLLDRHPYDLSAGEMQRAALVKALLQDPDILLLDEPTKGLDAFSRREIGAILTELKKAGKTIVVVTHDIEFAAMYGDRCSMLFSGGLIAEDFARAFFGNNMFYTTAINRMTRGLVGNCILEEDVVRE